MNRGLKALVATSLVVLLAAGSFVGGMLFQQVGGALPVLGSIAGTPSSSKLPALVEQVDSIIANNALVPSAESSITAGALQGMLGSLEDTYAVYYDPQQYSDLQADQKGEFYGIGISIGLNKNGQPYAARVFADTPASRGGIKTGDVLSAVNGVHKTKWDLEDFVRRVRGPLGTKVTIEITRSGKAPFSLVLTRGRITVPNTVTKMYGDVGYVRLMTFNDRSAADVATAIKSFDAKGAKGYVLDLRDNPGGLLTAAVDVTSLFVKDGVVVRVDERGKPEEEDSTTGLYLSGKPLVVLVDAYSASASEIVTGALKDYTRATVVGTITYGKGSVQTVLPIANGGAVKLTIAHYLTPLKHAINGIGVHPDVTVAMDPKLQADPAKDAQLQKALAVLRSKL